MSIVEHQIYKFQQKIAAEKNINAKTIFEWFKEAHQNGLSSHVLMDSILTDGGRIQLGWEDISRDLVAWCRTRSFSYEKDEQSQSVSVGMGAAFDALIDPAPFARWLKRTLASEEDGATHEPYEISETEDVDEGEARARDAFQALSSVEQKTFGKWALDRVRWAEEYEVGETSELINLAVSSFVEADKAQKQLEASLDELEEIGHFEGYSRFWPAWEVEGAVWDEAFAEENPAAVIGFYLKNFFETRPKTQQINKANDKLNVLLSADDEQVLSWLFDAAAEQLSEKSHRNPKGATAAQIRRALLLKAGCPLLNWLHPQDRDFSEVVAKLPPDLAGAAINLWIRQFPADPSHLKDDPWQDNDAEIEEFAQRETDFVANTILAHINHTSNPDNNVPSLPDDIEINYEELFSTLSQLESNSIDTGSLQMDLAEAIITQRDTFFEGSFPFSIRDAEKIFESLRHQPNSHWFSQITSFYHIQTKYGVRRLEFYEGAQNAVELHPRKRALTRFEAYHNAFKQMRVEHLDELAAAWWAFFIATQAIAFGSMALSAKENAQIAKIANSVLPNSMMIRALQFASGIASKNHTLDARITHSTLEPLILALSNPEEKDVNVFELGRSRASIEKFLIAQITKPVWDNLQSQTKDRLIEAEGYWSRSYFEAGAVRKDWWSPVSALGAALEIEMRITFEPILRRAHELALDPFRSSDPFPKELTIGSILKGIGNAHNNIKRQDTDTGDLGRNLSESFEILRKVNFMRELRNKAVHGKTDISSFAEFIKARDILIARGLFSEFSMINR